MFRAAFAETPSHYRIIRLGRSNHARVEPINLRPNLCPVHMYPDIFESATFSFRIRLPSTRIRRIRQRIREKIVESRKNKSATNPIRCGRVNPDIFESDNVKRVSSLSPNNKPIWRRNVEGEQSKFPATISLYGACSEDILGQRSLGY